MWRAFMPNRSFLSGVRRHTSAAGIRSPVGFIRADEFAGLALLFQLQQLT
jgi:hypothetical protein